MKNENERLLYEILNEAFPDQWESDTMFLEGRKHRGDAVNKSKKILIEIEGGLWLKTPGRHNQPIGYMNDMEKYNLATLQGWKSLRYSPSTLKKHPERIVLDVMELMGESPNKINTKNTIRAKIEDTKQFQVRLS